MVLHGIDPEVERSLIQMMLDRMRGFYVDGKSEFRVRMLGDGEYERLSDESRRLAKAAFAAEDAGDDAESAALFECAARALWGDVEDSLREGEAKGLEKIQALSRMNDRDSLREILEPTGVLAPPPVPDMHGNYTPARQRERAWGWERRIANMKNGAVSEHALSELQRLSNELTPNFQNNLAAINQISQMPPSHVNPAFSPRHSRESGNSQAGEQPSRPKPSAERSRRIPLPLWEKVRMRARRAQARLCGRDARAPRLVKPLPLQAP